jgi:hypothetical protein
VDRSVLSIGLVTLACSNAPPPNDQDVASTTMSVVATGAKCDGVTDDTAAIERAIAALPSGGTLSLPEGGHCLVSGSGSALITLTKAISIVGAGMEGAGASCLVAKAGTPKTTDFIQVAPNDVRFRGIAFRDLCLTIQSGTGGQIGIHLITNGNNASTIGDLTIDHVYINSAVTTGSGPGIYSVLIDNAATNTTGGTFNAVISNNFLPHGIGMNNAGDSIRILNNFIRLENDLPSPLGIVGSLMSGAGGLEISGNNMIVTAGCIELVGGGYETKISENECEQDNDNTEGNGAIIDILAGEGTTIVDNVIDNIPGTKIKMLVHVGAADGTVIDNNYLGSNTAAIWIESSATQTYIGPSNRYFTQWYWSNLSTSTVFDDPVAGVAAQYLPPTAGNGSRIFVIDGAPGTYPCTGGGSGATGFRENGAWRCI